MDPVDLEEVVKVDVVDVDDIGLVIVAASILNSWVVH